MKNWIGDGSINFCDAQLIIHDLIYIGIISLILFVFIPHLYFISTLQFKHKSDICGNHLHLLYCTRIFLHPILFQVYINASHHKKNQKDFPSSLLELFQTISLPYPTSRCFWCLKDDMLMHAHFSFFQFFNCGNWWRFYSLRMMKIVVTQKRRKSELKTYCRV